MLYEHAVRDAPFFILLSGRVEFVDRKPGKDVHVSAADAGTYIGDIAAFTGEPTISACVAVEPTEVLEFDRAKLRKMVAAWPEFGEGVFRTLLARRSLARRERLRGDAADRAAGLPPRLRSARPARAQPPPRPLVRRRRRPRGGRDARAGWRSRARKCRCSSTPGRCCATPPPPRSPAASACAPRSTAGASTSSSSAPARPGSPPRSTAARRACGRWWSSPGRPAARPGRAPGSRTTSASRPGSAAAS